MYTQIITIPTEQASRDEQQTLCEECAAVCARLTGVQAHQWVVNQATNTVCGVMKWTDCEAIAMGTESLRMEVAWLRDADHLLTCREIPCPGSRRFVRHENGTTPNHGFVQHPPDYDPRG